MVKKLFVILSALVCVLGFSVISLASTVYKPEQHSFIHEEDGYYVLDIDVKASQFTDEQLSLWNSFTDALTGNSTDIPFVIYNKSGNQLTFGSVEPNTYFFYFASGSSSYQLHPNSGNSFSVMNVDISSGVAGDIIQYDYSKTLVITYSSSTYVFWGYEKLSSNDSRDGNNKDRINYVDWDGMRLQIKDDLGDEPEDPDPPSSSSTGWIPPVISDPVIPAGDEYVFYDTAILSDFLKYVRDAMGKSMNIGWMIFGFILMWLVVKKVLKSFSSR